MHAMHNLQTPAMHHKHYLLASKAPFLAVQICFIAPGLTLLKDMEGWRPYLGDLSLDNGKLVVDTSQLLN